MNNAIFRYVISFTGSRSGLTKPQSLVLLDKILERKLQYKLVTLIHGDCIGADTDAHYIAMSEELEVRKRPCNIEPQRAFTLGGEIVSSPESPLQRNHKIVNDGNELISCPSGFGEKLRSGTWATTRYARKINKPILIIYPDGSFAKENDYI